MSWRLYASTAPSISGYEVNTGWLNAAGKLSLSNNGGVKTSKIFSGSHSIFYVERSKVEDNIINGIYTPTTEPTTRNIYILDTYLDSIEGASCTVNGDTKTSNSDGLCSFESLTDGIYAFTVTKSGYVVAQGNLEILSGHDITIVMNTEYSLRSIGPAGGYIAYVNPSYETDGWKYKKPCG